MDGSLDTGFLNGVTGADDVVNAVAVLSNGDVLIAGNFTDVNGASRSRIARLNSDGSLDTGFTCPAALTAQSEPWRSAPMGKWSLVVTSPASPRAVARTASPASMPTALWTPLSRTARATVPNGFVEAIPIQPDGKILVGGGFTVFNQLTAGRVVRLTVEGAVDPQVNFGTGADNTVNAITVQSDGRIVLGGTFTNFNGVARNRIVRVEGGLNTDNGTIAFAAANFNIDESQTNVVLQLVRNGGLNNAVAINYSTLETERISPRKRRRQ